MREGERRPTVKDVAAAAGVSPMTVSRTLAGGQHVRPEVQERVREAVRALGYHRDENARSIRPGHRSRLLGLAITNIANPYYGTMALGAEQAAAEAERRIVLGTTAESPEREARLLDDLLSRRVEGLLVVPAGGADRLERVIARGVPVVTASRRIEGLAADSVVLADEQGAHEATAMLLSGGHRRIGYLGNVPAVVTSMRRLAGYRRAHAEAGMASDPALVTAGQQDVAAAGRATARLLALADPPTALFCANNRNTVGALTELGRRIAAGEDPRALPVVMSFDEFELSGLMPVPVGLVRHDAAELGRVAVGLLLDRLEGRATGEARRLELPVEVAEPAGPWRLAARRGA